MSIPPIKELFGTWVNKEFGPTYKLVLFDSLKYQWSVIPGEQQPDERLLHYSGRFDYNVSKSEIVLHNFGGENQHAKYIVTQIKSGISNYSIMFSEESFLHKENGSIK